MIQTTFFDEVKKLAAHGVAFTKENEQFDKFVVETMGAFKKTLPTNIDDKHPLHESMNEAVINFNSTFDKWGEQLVANKHTQQFRSEFDNQFLIIIYGKVKAGKSTLGNFVASEYKNQTGLSPKFFQYDKAGQEKDAAKLEEMNDDGFETKVVECTSTIQGFKADGLVWIDTPGLGSMTDENGELAKKYIEKADLVIFPLSSDSPARQSDLAEIKEIIELKGKNVLVIITKSDTVEEDEDENGEIIKIITPKSPENRKSQEDYVRSELKKIHQDGFVKSDILSTSVRLAKDNHDGSNLDKFFDLLSNVIKNDGVELKSKEPLNRLRAFKGRLLNEVSDDFSIKNLKQKIDNFDKTNKKIKTEFLDKSSIVEKRTITDCIALIDKEITKEDFEKTNDGKQKVANLEKKAARITQENLNEIMSGVFKDIQKHTDAIQVHIGQVDTQLKDNVVQKEIEYKRRVGSWRSDTVLDNRVVNSVFGEAYDIITEYKTIDIKVGDNYLEIKKNLNLNFTDTVKREMEKQKQNLQKMYFSPMENFVLEFNKHYEQAFSRLKDGN